MYSSLTDVKYPDSNRLSTKEPEKYIARRLKDLVSVDNLSIAKSVHR